LNLQKNWIHKILYKNISKNLFPEVNEKSDLFYRKFFGFATQKNKTYVDEVMNDWANLAVEGHFTVKTMVGLSNVLPNH
jgi:regulation of enolase protein 1 (concanavalin A-like superfamily)